MFEYSFIHWTSFLAAAIVLNLSPGPDIAFILGQTARRGKRAGFVAMAGIWTGAIVHVLFAALGLSAVLASSAVAFSFVKWAGAAYLIYLGIAALRSGGCLLADRSGPPRPLASLWRQGFLISLLNPKVAIFFLAFLPQFVVIGAGPVWAQLLLHGVLVIGVAAVIEPPLILIGERMTRVVRTTPRAGLWLERMFGAMLISLGIKLALDSR